MYTLTFGSDPELFLTEGTGSDVVIPAVGLVGGTKDKPLMVGNYGMQEDNVMGEYTIPVSDNPQLMVEYAVDGARQLIQHVRTKTGRRLGVLHAPTAFFSNDVLAAAGPQALQFGCSPDYDAYAMGAPHPIVDPTTLNYRHGAYRFAGGHLHIGYKHFKDMPEYVAAMFCDLAVGCSLVWVGEQQGRRRTLYGIAGRYRPTRYGIEYRTPSNAWVYDQMLREAVVNGLVSLQNLLNSSEDTLLRLYNEVPWNDLRQMIATEDVTSIQEMGAWLRAAYPSVGFTYGG